MFFKFTVFNFEIKNEIARIPSIAWSPNGRKLAIATDDRHVYIYDDKSNRRDKFSTKPSDSQVS